ncbi:hypothetical protein GCM10028827_28410 [Mucilaginibacter myungsuensis]
MVRGQSRSQYYKLALNLTKGRTYYYITNSKSSVTQTINNKNNGRSTELNSRTAFTLTAIRDSLYDMDVRYESISLKMTSPGGVTVYNSFRADPGDPASMLFAAVAKQTFKVTLTKSGNLQSVNGITAIIDQLIGQASNIPVDQKNQIKSLMQQTIGEVAFRTNFEMATPILPSVQVRLGVLWSSDMSLSGAGSADVHTVYELKDVAEEFYHIRSSSSIQYPDKDTFKLVNGMQVRNNLEGVMASDIVIDKTTGWLKQASLYQSIEGNTEIKDNPKVPGGIKMPMTMRSDVVITDVH